MIKVLMLRINLKIKNYYGSKVNQEVSISVPEDAKPEVGGLVTWKTALAADGYGLAVVEKIKGSRVVAKLLSPETDMKIRAHINAQLPKDEHIILGG